MRATGLENHALIIIIIIQTYDRPALCLRVGVGDSQLASSWESSSRSNQNHRLPPLRAVDLLLPINNRSFVLRIPPPPYLRLRKATNSTFIFLREGEGGGQQSSHNVFRLPPFPPPLTPPPPPSSYPPSPDEETLPRHIKVYEHFLKQTRESPRPGLPTLSDSSTHHPPTPQPSPTARKTWPAHALLGP